MPKVPEYKSFKSHKDIPKTVQERIDARYWRYKKSTTPEELKGAGKVVVRKPKKN